MIPQEPTTNSQEVPRPESQPESNSRPLSLTDRVRSLRLPERHSAPARGRGWLPWGLCGVLAVAAAFFALRPAGDADEAKKPATPRSLEKGGAGTPRDTPGEIALEAKGYIIPISKIQVSPKVSGMVMELFIEEGKRVKEGFVLARLETVDYQADVDRAKGQVAAAERRLTELTDYRKEEIEQARAEWEDTKEQCDQLKKDWERSKALRNSQALSEREWELAKSSYISMDFRMKRLDIAYRLMVKGPRDERIEAAKAELKQAGADLVKATWRLDNCEVRAPVAGTILTKKAEKGAIVNPVAFSNGVAASLCDMADLTKMEVELNVAERDLAKVFVGQECRIHAEPYPDRIYHGKVARRMPIADRSNGTVAVRVQIDIPAEEEGRYLLPDMGAIVTFLNKKK